ncbi:MAG: molecular chaperone HtpG [Solobacterium sp.]|nr:molecular chaperone HtpG [Solobacterium sp.]
MAKKQFKAESKRLLELMINSIYTNKEIFLRELISNASDALDKRHYLSLTDPSRKVSSKDLKITLEADKENRTLVIQDTGIGMTAEELEKNLGTIAKSGSAEFRAQLEKAEKNIDIIGQFGVGFYSAFMVAKRILVETRSAQSDQAYSWSSSGEDGYIISPIEKEQIGTRITLTLKEDTDDEKYSEYLEEYKIRDLVRKYSDYVRYPIMMEVTRSIPDPTDDKKTIDTKEMETLNSMIPLWKKQKSKIKDEEYNEFYKSKFNDWEDPQKVIHYNVEGTLSYTALMFIPSRTPYNFYYQDFEPGLRLYSRGVFILDKAKDLLPDYFRFVTGLVDSEDLNLNISREILQQDRQVRALARSIEKKIQNALEDMLKNDREGYEKFFENFGLNLKFGIYKDYGINKDKLQDLILFRSSAENKYVTLKEYIERMKEDQDKIYYACGTSVEEIEQLPVMSRIKDKGYEVLYFLDERDEFVSGIMRDYDGKEFQSVSSAGLDLDSEEEKKEKEEKAQESKGMLEAMKDALGSRVKEVRVSSRLKDDPVCVVADEGISLEMEKYMANDPMNKGTGVRAVKILEINPSHPIFAKLQEIYQNDPEKLADYADVLLNQALLIQGLPIENPVEYARKITDLMIG